MVHVNLHFNLTFFVENLIQRRNAPSHCANVSYFFSFLIINATEYINSRSLYILVVITLS